MRLGVIDCSFSFVWQSNSIHRFRSGWSALNFLAGLGAALSILINLFRVNILGNLADKLTEFRLADISLLLLISTFLILIAVLGGVGLHSLVSHPSSSGLLLWLLLLIAVRVLMLLYSFCWTGTSSLSTCVFFILLVNLDILAGGGHWVLMLIMVNLRTVATGPNYGCLGAWLACHCVLLGLGVWGKLRLQRVRTISIEFIMKKCVLLIGEVGLDAVLPILLVLLLPMQLVHGLRLHCVP